MPWTVFYTVLEPFVDIPVVKAAEIITSHDVIEASEVASCKFGKGVIAMVPGSHLYKSHIF